MNNVLNRLKEKQNKKGFTVLVILAILAAIAITSVLGYVEDARKHNTLQKQDQFI